jgi:hypothetical protein
VRGHRREQRVPPFGGIPETEAARDVRIDTASFEILAAFHTLGLPE